jgi:hypothetical protein
VIRHPIWFALCGTIICFQQGNDPTHLQALKGYLTMKESDGVLHQMTWPPQSPDLNQIAMVWDDGLIPYERHGLVWMNVLFHSFDVFTIIIQCRK